MKNPKAEQNTFTINTDMNTTIDGEQNLGAMIYSEKNKVIMEMTYNQKGYNNSLAIEIQTIINMFKWL